MRIAAVDIGTNTILLLVCDIDASGELNAVHHEQRVPRIGRDVDARGSIAQDAFDRAAAVLTEYAAISQSRHADQIAACATSAVRDAQNSKEFIAHCSSVAGIPIRVLTGTEEALLTYRGATLSLPPERRHVAVIDIGGGSTEIIFPESAQGRVRRVSLQTGAVRISERHFQELPPSPEQLANARGDVRDLLRQQRIPGPLPGTLVGVAGTVTTIACLDQCLDEFSISRVEGYTMPRETIDRWLETLTSLSAAEIRSLSQTTAGREDILTAGVLILREMMHAYDFMEITTTVRGLRYGFALQVWEDLRASARGPKPPSNG